ncbi:ATP-binding protein [Devosia sp.]|uniref:GAF domain-containing sensor histidine kinase n=1 Tax=Devosia sp. TaxID=1871048 RepID=UPI003264DEDD
MPRTVQTIDMTQILSILRAIAGQLDFRGVVSAASAEISALLPHDHLDVAIMDSKRTMVSAYETGLHTEWDASTTATKPVKVSPIRPLFLGKVDYILTDDAQNDPRFHFEGAFSKPIFAAGLRSRLHVPLKVERRVIGALSFSTQEIGTYRLEDVETARIVADILSSYFFALQQSELVRQSELQQVQAEARAEGLRIGALHLTEELENARQALGMDLHDQTLADLSRIARGLERAVGKPSLRGAELQPLHDDIEHCLRELRVIIDNAKPSVLQFFGFGQAVEALLERSVSSSAGLTYCLQDDGDTGLDELPPNTVVSLYRIVQEAINNSVRHARATHIAVSLNRHRGAARIVIADDGIGLGTAPGRRTGGLSNIRTRASLIEADLTVASGSDGKGTRLEILLPACTPAAQPVKASLP